MRKRPKPSMINPKERRRQQLKRGKLIILIILAIALIQLIAYRQRILIAIGTYLVYDQAPQQADMIAIPANWDDTIIRARGGADLLGDNGQPAVHAIGKRFTGTGMEVGNLLLLTPSQQLPQSTLGEHVFHDG